MTDGYCYGWCCGSSPLLYVGSTNNKIQTVDLDLTTATNTTDLLGNSLQKMDFDSSGNVYVADGNKLYKFGPNLGSPIWEKTFVSDGFVVGIAVDATNGWVYTSCSPNTTTKCVRKFQASDGVEITSGGWPYDLGTSTTGSPVSSFACALDSNLDLWVGHYPSTGSGNPGLTKLDSDGSKIADYQPFPSGGTHYQYPRHITIDESDNLYCAMARLGADTVVENLTKVDSSGSKVWGKAPDGSTSDGYWTAVNGDDDRIAVCGDHNGGPGDNDIYVYDDSGTLVWADNWGLRSNSCVYDTDDNLFVGILDLISPHDSVIRYDSSGSQDATIDLMGGGQSVALFLG